MSALPPIAPEKLTSLDVGLVPKAEVSTPLDLPGAVKMKLYTQPERLRDPEVITSRTRRLFD